ncbi:protein translocase subunit SecF [Candidatus Uhrbacteria bacterium]|nr:protein translocase subunit SecF [Candidatus Uhrbacteria bacterium]
MLSFVAHRRRWYLFSGVLVAASIIAIAVWRFNFGIDFTGGSLLEFSFTGDRPGIADVQQRITDAGATRVKVQTAGDHNIIIRTAPIASDVHAKITDAYADVATEQRFESIGPSIGRELARKAATGLVLSLAAIMCYIAWVFRKASREVSSWAYGVVAFVAMLHDILIPMGVFAILGAFRHVEVDAPFIAALLTILGYSINDTIIVLDRVRENVNVLRGKPFTDIVEASIRQSFARSVNTTLTTVLALLAVILIGGPSIRYFAIALAIGIGVGAYSSIFIAAPLLVTWYERKRRQN